MLYYYSFLNFAKAYLGGKKVLSSKELTSASLMHGICSKSQQNITNIMDYEIEVFPPNNHTNIFFTLCQTITKQNWPFTNKITLQMREFICYSPDISIELVKLFGIPTKIIPMRSLILDDEKSSMWIEFLLPTQCESF